MPGKSLVLLHRLAAPRDIEESRGLRITVWAATCISILALARNEVISEPIAAASLLLITAGSYLSWWRRHRANIPVKAIIAVLAIVALVSFLRQSYLQPYDPRIPLAELFLWVQGLHSFDLPRRRDLLFSLVSSFILLALAASYSLSASFAWLALLWLACAVPALYFAQGSRLASLSRKVSGLSVSKPVVRGVSATLSGLLGAVTVAGLVFGAFLPRVSASYLRSLPFSLRRPWYPSEGYQFQNPGYPQLPLRPPENPLEVNPEAYFGFGTYLDLRMRGTLVDLPVMKVRATEPAYWAGLIFRDYNGYSWLLPEGEAQRLTTDSQPFTIPEPENQAHTAKDMVIQTYYLLSEQPNVIFSAYRPRYVYYPSDYIFQDESGLKSPFVLDEGLVYSVVSYCIDMNDDQLAQLGRFVREGEMQPYLEVPPLPERVIRLAEEIVPEDGGPLERARAIEDYLERECRYSLDVASLPPGREAVDFFLFDSKQGYCEHFATAYAVLCRLAGIPSRVVTGYSTGDYNPFTGLYEVSLDDAHAWVEIYLAGVGWVARDPTPGFDLPAARRSRGFFWVFGDFFSWMGRNLASVLPPSVRSAFRRGGSALAKGVVEVVIGLAYSSREAPWLPAFLFLMLASAITAKFFLYRRRRLAGTGHAGDPLSVMSRFLETMEWMGLPRLPWQTLEEYLAQLSRLIPGLELGEELLLFERTRYGGERLEEGDFLRFRRGMARALEAARARLSRSKRLLARMRRR